MAPTDSDTGPSGKRRLPHTKRKKTELNITPLIMLIRIESGRSSFDAR